MERGERATGSAERATGSAERATGSAERATGSAERAQRAPKESAVVRLARYGRVVAAIWVVSQAPCANAQAVSPVSKGLTAAPFTAGEMVAVRRAHDPAISPDGSKVAFWLTAPDLIADTTREELYIADARSPHRVTRVPNDVVAPIWARSSRALTYVKQNRGCAEVWEYDLRLQATRRLGDSCLAPAGAHYALMKWSPSGALLAYVAQAATDEDANLPRTCMATHPERGVVVGVWWMGGTEICSSAMRHHAAVAGPLPPRRVWLYDPAKQVARPLTDSLLDVTAFDWDPTGRRVAVLGFTRRDATLGIGGELPGGEATVRVLRSSDGSAIVEIPAGHRDDRPDMFNAGTLLWSPDGTHIALRGPSEVKVYSLEWRRESNARVANTWEHALSPPPSRRSALPTFMIWGMAWGRNSRNLLLLCDTAMRRSLLSLEIPSGHIRDVLPDTKWYDAPTFADDRRTFAMIRETVTEPPVVVVGAQGAGGVHVVAGEALLNPRLRGGMDAAYDTISWPSADHRWTIHGVLVTPHGIAQASNLPLIVMLYGGPLMVRMRYNGGDPQTPGLIAVSRGYAVLYPNTRGRGGYGRLFRDAIVDEASYLAKPWTDVEAGIDYLVTRGIVDGRRIGIIGHSYGGALTAYGIGVTRRFHAAVIKDATNLNIAPSVTDKWGIAILRDYYRDNFFPIESPFDSVGRRWIEAESPLSRVANVATPTLLEYAAGYVDAVVNANPFYQALQYYGVPSELVLYPTASHLLGNRPSIAIASLSRDIEWLNGWLETRSRGVVPEAQRR
jgi:dipeptidyl aminopeptidase/acylaminoacyl peptidase